MSAINTKIGVPGINLAALDAIPDQNTRQVLRDIVDGWHVRNGSSGKGDMRFITAGELGDLAGRVGGLSRTVDQLQSQGSDRPLTSGQISRVISDLQASVMESTLFKELGDRIRLIDLTAAKNLADGLLTEAQARQAAITQEQTIRQEADSSLAQQITTVTAAVGQNAAGLQQEITARANGDTAEAQARELLAARVGSAEGAILSEATTRLNADNAIVTNVNTQFASVNGNLSALQVSQTNTANNVAALSSSVSTLQVQVGANTVALQNEATARVNADNDIYVKWSVKTDVNGYVSGFGLISEANNSTPHSDFIVRADRFAIGSPTGAGITPKVPFIVLTTTDAKGNPPGTYIDYAMIKNADIGRAKIDDAAVNTLKIDGEAVIVPRVGEGVYFYSLDTSWTGAMAPLTFMVDGLKSDETCRVMVTAVVQAYPSDGTEITLSTGIFADGNLNSDVGSTLSSKGMTVSWVGSFLMGNGYKTVDLRAKCSPASGGASSKGTCTFVVKFIIMTAKR